MIIIWYGNNENSNKIGLLRMIRPTIKQGSTGGKTIFLMGGATINWRCDLELLKQLFKRICLSQNLFFRKKKEISRKRILLFVNLIFKTQVRSFVLILVRQKSFVSSVVWVDLPWKLFHKSELFKKKEPCLKLLTSSDFGSRLQAREGKMKSTRKNSFRAFEIFFQNQSFLCASNALRLNYSRQ